MSDWEEQWERVKRWFERVERIENGVTNEPFDAAKFKDDYLAFFQNCYHLKDHLQNDPNVKISDQPIKNLFKSKNSKNMAYCKEICNASKHLAYGNLRNPETGEEPEPADGAIIRDHPSTGEVSASYRIETNTGDKDAFSIVKECMNEWRQFLQSKNLI